ncbi:MAG TPA: HAMP domain-containing sensor histidine kinase [Myxococcota bacterium]|nr:HAMP domain-containing sensor histidine kinase [Myxococcota bacterium]
MESNPRSAMRVPGGRGEDSRAEAVLRWLVPLRFLEAAAQGLALLVAYQGLALPLPYARLVWIPVAVLATNIALAKGALRERVAARPLVLSTLLFDCALFTLLLHWSGGPDSPFSALYVIPIVLAAMTGSRHATWIVAATAAGLYALVFPLSAPQHFWHAAAWPGATVGLHAVGMWAAVLVVAVVITFFMTRIVETLKGREDEMRRLGELAARNARLASLTTLAAGAAHELGSPLGTIAVVARDLERAAEAARPPDSLLEDARLLRSEVERCRAILDRMRARAVHEARETEAPLFAEDVADALEEVLREDERGRVAVDVKAPPGVRLCARADYVEVAGPVLRNALDASSADSTVEVEVALEPGGLLRTVVRDAGSGMDAETLSHVGEPFYTTRPPGRGTGLGLFVVNLHLERLGGSLVFSSTPEVGTTAVLEWPVEDEAPTPPGGGSTT